MLTTITAVFATCNLYYFVAVQNHYDLFNYWLMGTISIIISYLLLVIGGMFTLLKLPKVTKRWGGKTKTHFGLLLTALSAFIYIERIIEYILVPNVGIQVCHNGKYHYYCLYTICSLSIYYAIQ